MDADRRRSASRPAIGTLAVVAVLCGCGRGADRDHAATTTVPTPLTQVWGSDPMMGTYPKAEFWSSVQQCLGDAGYDLDLSPYAVEEPKSDEIAIVASVFGPPENPLPDPLVEYEERLTPQQADRFNAVLHGANVDDEGCIEVSRRATLGYVDITPEMSGAFDEISAVARADDSVIRANEGWSDCMAEVGFDFDNRTQLLEDLQARADRLLADANNAGVIPSDTSPEAQQDLAFERAASEANIECVKANDLDNIERAAVARAQSDYLESHPDFAHPTG